MVNLRTIVDPWSRGPVWFRRTRTMEITTLVIIGLAAGVETWRIGYDDAGWGGYIALLVSIGGTAMAWDRPWPGMVLLAAAPAVAPVVDSDPLVPWTIAVFATFLFTLRGLPGLPVGLLVCTANFASVLAYDGTGVADVYAIVAATAALAAAATGSAVRGHRRYWIELDNRARDAIATREIEVERRVAEERIRIARDLHDIVGHEVAVINMHLGAAEVNLSDPDVARTDIAAARRAVQAVLRETQNILDILRVGAEDDPCSPTADFRRLPELVSTFRSAGLDIDATIDQTAEPLAPNVSTAAFRVAQEAMTNAQRHGTGSMTLRVLVDRGAVTVSATNPKRSMPSERPTGFRGYGLIGMQERAASAGGYLEVDNDGDTFRIRALLRPTKSATR